MTQQLRFRKEFEDILKNYQPSENLRTISLKTRIALFDGPSASGRNTIMEELIRTKRYQQIVSDTTRLPRSNNGITETDGREYWFKSEEDFLDGLRGGLYVEAAIIHDQQVSGVSIRELERISRSNKIAVNDIQSDGVDSFRALNPSIVCVFVIPPDFNTWLQRLELRGSMTDIEKSRRLVSAQQEIRHALAADYYKFIVNNGLNEAVALADKLCSGEEIDTSPSREVAQEMLRAIDAAIAD